MSAFAKVQKESHVQPKFKGKGQPMKQIKTQVVQKAKLKTTPTKTKLK